MEKKMTDDNKKNIDDASTDLKKSDKKDLSPSKTKNQLDKKVDETLGNKPAEVVTNSDAKKTENISDSKKVVSVKENKDSIQTDKKVEPVKKVSEKEKVSGNLNESDKPKDKESSSENRKILKKAPAKKKDTKTDSVKDDSVEKKKIVDSDSDNGDLVEKLVSINRVAKVVKGGRRFSFAALVVVGDGNGMVGHGKGKAKEVPEAIKKATDEAKNNMIRVPLRQGRTLHHDIHGRYDAGKVYLRSAPSGTGVIAGGPMRAVFEALGIQDIVAKSVGTSNPHNMIRATFQALKNASSPKIIAYRRGLKINEITKRRKSDQESSDAKN